MSNRIHEALHVRLRRERSRPTPCRAASSRAGLELHWALRKLGVPVALGPEIE